MQAKLEFSLSFFSAAVFARAPPFSNVVAVVGCWVVCLAVSSVTSLPFFRLFVIIVDSFFSFPSINLGVCVCVCVLMSGCGVVKASRRIYSEKCGLVSSFSFSSSSPLRKLQVLRSCVRACVRACLRTLQHQSWLRSKLEMSLENATQDLDGEVADSTSACPNVASNNGEVGTRFSHCVRVCV